MSKLKRCPFCGDEVEIVPTGLYYWKYAIHHKGKTECILDANAFALPYEEAEAVRMWNTRSDRNTEPNCEECKYAWWNSEAKRYECSIVKCPYSREDEPQTVLEAVLDRQTDEDRRKMAESVRKAIKDEPQTDEPKWTCERCGFENHADFKWCFKCGFHKPERSE